MEEGLYVDGKKLCTADVAEIRRKALEGLDSILACDVVHMDAKFNNIRVEKVSWRFRVWWIDFGLAEKAERDEDKEVERSNCIGMLSPYL